jgi:hypothetical protein
MRPILNISFLTVLALLFSGLSALAWADAENPADYLHTRTYIGVVGTSISMDTGGLFSGLNYSRVDNPGYEVDLIPALQQNFGFGILLGHREEAWAVELSYWQSNHNATFGPGVVSSESGSSVTFTQQYQDTAVYSSVNIDFKRYFFTDSQTQPFINLGVCFPWITVNNAAEDGFGNISSLTLAGLGLDLGVGVEYYLSPNLSFFGGAYKRWASFDEFKGLQAQYDQITQYSNGGSPTDAGGGFNFAIGTSIGFE